MQLPGQFHYALSWGSEYSHTEHRFRLHKSADYGAALDYLKYELLLFYGDTFYVEKMHYKALQKRSSETEIDAKTGKIHSKKRFGKSLGRCAPAMFISMLTQKAERYNGKVIKVDTFKTKASQFDHTDDSFTKKKLSQRFAKLSDGTVVRRDLYSAFLLAHLDDKHETYDKAAIGSDFPHFIEMHDKTKEHLQNSHDWLPASVGF